MPFDLASAPFSTATIRVPSIGAPSADASLVASSAGLTEGAPAILRAGDAAWSGTLRTGGDFGAEGRWTWIGGAGRWDSTVTVRAYHDPNGVMLSQVFRDLVREAGGSVLDVNGGGVLDAGAPAFAALDIPDRRLLAWTREAGLASAALEALACPSGAPPGTPGPWYVDAAGVTHIGARPLRSLAAPATLTIPHYDAALRLATLRLADDALAALLPGCVLSSPTLPADLTIASVIIRATPGSIDLDAFGEQGIPDLLRSLFVALSAGGAYARIVPMVAAEVQVADAASVNPVVGDARSVAIPGAPLLPQVYGVPGVTAQLAPGAPVLVTWQGADPASPSIVLYPPGTLPASLTFAAGALALNGPTSLGGPAGSGSGVLVDTLGAFMLWARDVEAKLLASGHPVAAPLTGCVSATTKAVP